MRFVVCCLLCVICRLSLACLCLVFLVDWWLLIRVCRLLSVVRSSLFDFVVRSYLHVRCTMLFVACCLMIGDCCLLFVVRCLRFVVRCSLCVVCCLLLAV